MATHAGRRTRLVLCALIAFVISVSGALLAAGLVWPEASGDAVKKKGNTTLDMSHARDGYVMVKYKKGKKKSDKKIKARLSMGETSYTYDLRSDGEYETYPLQLGNGNYTLRVLEQVEGNSYAQASNQEFKVKDMEDDAPFLCPNQYVWYAEDSGAVQKSIELCEGLSTDEEKVKAIYAFVTQHFTYDFMRALTIRDQAGYLPDIDAIYEERKGICFDLAAIMACMLRVQGIPTQLVIGHADVTYHAWNNVFVGGQYVRYDATAGLAGMSVQSYTQERIY